MDKDLRKSMLLTHRLAIQDDLAATQQALQAHPTNYDPQTTNAITQIHTKAIERIDGALARLEGGEHDTCISCGAQIGDERIDRLLMAHLCERCATD